MIKKQSQTARSILMCKYCAPVHWGSTQQFDHTSFMLLCYTEMEKKKKAPLLSLTLLSFHEFICFLTLMVFSSKQESDLYRSDYFGLGKIWRRRFWETKHVRPKKQAGLKLQFSEG